VNPPGRQPAALPPAPGRDHGRPSRRPRPRRGPLGGGLRRRPGEYAGRPAKDAQKGPTPSLANDGPNPIRTRLRVARRSTQLATQGQGTDRRTTHRQAMTQRRLEAPEGGARRHRNTFTSSPPTAHREVRPCEGHGDDHGGQRDRPVSDHDDPRTRPRTSPQTIAPLATHGTVGRPTAPHRANRTRRGTHGTSDQPRIQDGQV